jgi:hypothetical protein
MVHMVDSLDRSRPAAAAKDDKDRKISDPKPFKGDPKDLDRFLIHLENKFSAEPNRFKEDIIKIRFAAQLLEDKAHRWYKSYHLQISEKDAYRVRGVRQLDPRYATWERFEASLRTSFGERITRDSAVTEWLNLRHTNSIDDYIDAITRLMWETGYDGKTAEDKIKRGLNDELSKDWSKVFNKPKDIGEQLMLLRQMGHDSEEHAKERKEQNAQRNPRQPQQQQQQQGSGNKNPDKNSNTSGQSKGKGKGKGKGKEKKDPSERKDKEEELKGISKEVLNERAKDGNCLKCGKSGHKWFDCWCKAPVTSRVVAGAKRKGRDSGEGESKKAKGASASTEPTATAASGRIIEIPEDLDDDLDLWELPLV